MAWWVYLLIAGAALFFFFTALALILPVRIFIRYLRKNRNDRVTMVIGQAHWETRLYLYRFDRKNEVFIMVRLAWWEFRVPVMRRIIEGQDSLILKLGRWEYHIPGRSLYQTLKRMAGTSGPLLRRVKPLIKRVSVERLNLKVTFGLEDPAVTGIMAGGFWALAGLLTGMLKRFFTVAAAPRILIDPRFNGEPLRVWLEGEMAMPLFRWLQLWMVTRKIGGVTSGTSSH